MGAEAENRDWRRRYASPLSMVTESPALMRSMVTCPEALVWRVTPPAVTCAPPTGAPVLPDVTVRTAVDAAGPDEAVGTGLGAVAPPPPPPPQAGSTAAATTTRDQAA